MNYQENLKKLGLKLPEAKAPVGNYVATKISGKMLFVSGQISIDEKGELIKGKVGKDLDVDSGYNAAKRCALSIISQIMKTCDNDLTKIKSCIKLTGFVNSTDNFVDQPKVINGASDLIASVFGDAGMHTRAAVSVNSLPLGVAVEVDAIFELNLVVDDSPIIGYLEQSKTKNDAFDLIKPGLVPGPTISGKGNLVHEYAVHTGAKMLFSNYQTGWIGFN